MNRQNRIQTSYIRLWAAIEAAILAVFIIVSLFIILVRSPDVPDGDAPELNEFVPDERCRPGFYKDGISYVGVDVRVQSGGDVWVGELIVIPLEGMQFSMDNASFTHGCVVTPQYATGDPPQGYPLARSQLD